jgi:hypothetical protein
MPVVMSRDEARTVAVVRRSAIVRALESTVAAATLAWRHSIAGSISRSGAAFVQEQSAAGRARLGGGVLAVASATALALQQLASRPEPLIWIVPATSLILGLCVVVVFHEGSAR